MDTSIVADLVSVMGLALLVTKLVDTLRNALDPNDQLLKALWNVAAFILGIGVAYLFVGAGFEIAGAGPSTLGTGLIIGAVASGWHEVLDRISPKI